MSNITIKSHRKEREDEIIDGLQKSLEQVGALVERQAKINVSQSPSNHPQVRTGRLRASITHETNKLETVVGTNVVYGKYLEFDTSRMPTYPWLFPAVEISKSKSKQILGDRKFFIE